MRAYVIIIELLPNYLNYVPAIVLSKEITKQGYKDIFLSPRSCKLHASPLCGGTLYTGYTYTLLLLFLKVSTQKKETFLIFYKL